MKCIYCKKKIIPGNYYKTSKGSAHIDCYKKNNKCDYCGNFLENEYVIHNNKKYHKHCYNEHIAKRCVVCGKPITKKYYKDESGFYHTKCYEQNKLPTCDICKKPIKGKYITDNFGNKSHTSHSSRKTKVCETCGRIISNELSNGYVKFNDGRIICGICKLTMVTDNSNINKLFNIVYKKLTEKGFSNIPKDIEVILTSRNTLKKHNKSKSNNLKGLATAKVTKSNNQKTTSNYKIYILYGVPELEFKGILAHEILHQWINANSIKIKQERILEAFCNLGSEIIYLEDRSKLSEIFLESLVTDKIYGSSFKKIKRNINKYGWNLFLDKIKKRRSLRLL